MRFIIFDLCLKEESKGQTSIGIIAEQIVARYTLKQICFSRSSAQHHVFDVFYGLALLKAGKCKVENPRSHAQAIALTDIALPAIDSISLGNMGMAWALHSIFFGLNLLLIEDQSWSYGWCRSCAQEMTVQVASQLLHWSKLISKILCRPNLEKLFSIQTCPVMKRARSMWK